MFKITKKKLEKAILEAVNIKKEEYKNLTFVDEIFKENNQHINIIKKMLREDNDNKSSKIHHYLLHECGCCSKYNDLASKTNLSPEQDLLYDYTNEDEFTYDGYYDQYSDDHRYEEAENEFIKVHGREPNDFDELRNFVDAQEQSDIEYEDNMQTDDMLF